MGTLVGLIGVTGLVSVAGCGSRTSTLDQEAYTYGFGDGGEPNVGTKPVGSAGRPSAAGTGNVTGSGGKGGGGAPSKPTPPPGGKGGGGSIDPTPATVPCQRYCPGYSTDCAQKLMPGQDCVASCEGEINGSGPVCQKLGITALTCLTPFFHPGLTCDTAINTGLGTCGPAVAAFQNCKTPTMVPTPAPTPTPLPPMPTMPPMIDVGSCLVTAGAVDPSSCKMSFSCPNGGFETYCSATPDGSVKNCACLGPSGQMASGVIKNVPEVCQLAATMLCRFP